MLKRLAQEPHSTTNLTSELLEEKQFRSPVAALTPGSPATDGARYSRLVNIVLPTDTDLESDLIVLPSLAAINHISIAGRLSNRRTSPHRWPVLFVRNPSAASKTMSTHAFLRLTRNNPELDILPDRMISGRESGENQEEIPTPSPEGTGDWL